MSRVGEAFYEITARDQKLVGALKNAEGKVRQTGSSVEGLGRKATTEFDKASVGVNRFGGAMEKAHPPTTKLGGAMKSLGQGLAQGVGLLGVLGIAGAATAMVGAFGRGVRAASDLNETITKTQVVFPTSSKAIIAWGETSATAFGMSQNAALGAAALYGNLFVSLGLAEKQSATMSVRLVELAGDLASFNNIDPSEALDALRSGLVGETEPLRRLGVNMNEATLQAKAMEMGLITTTKNGLTPAQKAQAAYALILEQTTTAQGDFARTSEGLANQQRIAAAKVENAFAKMGAVLLPLAAKVVPMLANAMVSLIEGIGGAVTSMGEFIKEHQRAFDVIGKIVGIIGGAFVTVLEGFALWIGNAFKGVEIVVGAVFDVIKFVVGGIIGTIRNIVSVAAEIPGPWQDAAKEMKVTLQGMQNDIEAWGQDTKSTAEGAGHGVIDGVTEPIKDGAPIVADASKTGITDPIVAAAADAKAGAAKEAKLTPIEIAKSLREGVFDVKSAIESIHDVQANTLSRTKEIAAIEGFLTGKALKKALNDARPEVRAEAEGWKTAAEDRLFALQHNVAGIALATGVSYADTLKDQKEKSRAAALAHTTAVRDQLQKAEALAAKAGRDAGEAFPGSVASKSNKTAATKAGEALATNAKTPLDNAGDKTRSFGKNVGSNFASGLWDALKAVIAAAAALAQAVWDKLHHSIPERDSPLYGLLGAGTRLVKTYADEIGDQKSYLEAKISRAFGGLSPTYAPTISPTVLHQRDNGGYRPVAGPTVHVHIGTLIADRYGVDQLQRGIADVLRMQQVPRPSMFTNRF